MKVKSARFFFSTSILSLALFPATASAVQYKWTGATDTTWATTSNWDANGVAPTNGTFVTRFNVNNSGTALTNPATYHFPGVTTTYSADVANGSRGLVIGSGTSGSMVISAGNLATTGSVAADIIGNGNNCTGTLTITGGQYISGNFGTALGAGGGTNRLSELTVSGTGSAVISKLDFNCLVANVSLNGGTLQTNAISYTRVDAASKIRFDGGTLKAGASSATFIPAHANIEVLVKAGGAVVDTNGFDITISEPFLQDASSIGGGLTKDGSGTLTLNATSTTTGSATINSGGLSVKASTTSWTPSSFSHSGNTLTFNLGTYSSSNVAPIQTGALTVNSAVSVNISASNLQVGQIPLIQYTSESIPGSLTLNSASLPPNVQATLEDNGTGLIYLNVTEAPATYVWSGNTATPGSGDWDTSSLNWNASSVAFSTSGAQVAEFPNLAGGGTVNLTDAYSPLSVSVANATGNPYTFNGSGKLTGSTLLNKSNTGRVTFSTGNHDYTGATTISGGALIKQSADLTTGSITVSSGASFALSGGITDGAGQTLLIGGAGIAAVDYFNPGSQAYRGALQAINGANTWEGDVVLTSTANTPTTVNRIGVQPGASLTLTGMISENVAGAYLLFRAGSSGENITLSGTGTYSYTNETQLYSNGGAIILGNDNKFPTAKLLNLTSGGTTVLDLNGYDQEFLGIYGGAVGAAATISNNGSQSSLLTVSPAATTSYTFNGLITDGSSSVSFVKNGAGTQVLGFANTYTGTTTVNSGTLLINAAQTAATGAVQINHGTLGGIGSIGGGVTVSATGTIAPGVTTGTLTVPSADLSSGATLSIDVNDANAAKADQLAVTGALNVENAKLVFNVTGAPAEPSYLIASAGSITGSINPANITGLPAGYELVQSASEIRLSQSAGSDYDDWFALYPSITNPADKLPTADPDGDGLTNQQEYAFGLAPNNAASSNPILTQLDKNAATFRYSRRSSSGLVYTIWTSSDLVTWNQDLTASQTLGTPDANNVQAVNVTLTGAPLTANKLFVRVKAE